ncbi:hypothetical protein UlMin_033644 [Ulmus minor]
MLITHASSYANPKPKTNNIKLDHLVDKARKLWDSSPPQVKSFPWNRAFDNFIQLVLDLVRAVVKYLSVPLLAVSSLTVSGPGPLIIGLAVVGVLRQTTLDVCPILKQWKLFFIGISMIIISKYSIWDFLFVLFFSGLYFLLLSMK